MPYFSIIIPTYNSEKTLSNCLESILKQSFINYEVLIIDGVSTDSTLSIVKGYQDSRLKVTSEQDTGIYDAMNKGIKLAQGEWLYFLGSDDCLYSRNVLMLVNNVTSKTNLPVIYGNVMRDDLSLGSKIYDGSFSIEKLLYQNICHQSIFYNKSVFDKIGHYNIQYSIHADWDLNLRCRAMFNFHYVDTIIALFSSGGYSQTGSDDLFHQDYLNNVAKYFFWQFYKKDFYQFAYPVLQKQFKEKHLIAASIILLQMKICHFRRVVSKTKRKIFPQL